MSPLVALVFIAAYFLVLIVIARLTAGKGDNEAFFLGGRKSPWYVVAFGMIGATLSGVTFISVPGWVEGGQWAYMQVVLGYIPGYLVIAFVLMPVYYRLRLTSIYTYLETRMGLWAYKTGAAYFLLSRTIGAAFRLYLVALVLQLAVMDKLDLRGSLAFLGDSAEFVTFGITVAVTIILIWLYTFRGGIKTIIWTDTLQTLFILSAVGIAVWAVASKLGLSPGEVYTTVSESEYSRVFFLDDWRESNYFWKQFIGGAFITIAMTGLDQDMMQKNLSCRNIKEAKTNMISFTGILVVVNVLFLSLGALLYIFAYDQGIALPEKGDELFATLALDGHLGPAVAIIFLLGLIAAAYSSADSALTALTTSFSVDFLEIGKRPEKDRVRIRKNTHLLFSVILFTVIMIFRIIDEDTVIKQLFVAATYTYGPLLGLYAFGLFTRLKVDGPIVPIICLLSPVACYFLNMYSVELLGGYKFSFELIVVNGLITFLGLVLAAKLMPQQSEPDTIST